MDFRHLIVTCLFSKLRLPFDNQKVKENYAIFLKNLQVFFLKPGVFLCNGRWNSLLIKPVIPLFPFILTF